MTAVTKKIKIMKKVLAVTFAAFMLVACNNTETDSTKIESTDSNDAVVVDNNNIPKSSGTTSESAGSASTTYTAMDGDVIYRDGKVKVMKNGQWVNADNDVKLDNGVVVYRNGRVRRDDLEIKLEDGEVVNKTGNFFDKTGRAIGNAWDVTKEGAKDAGRAIKNTAKKVGQKVENAVDNDDKKKKHQ